MITLYNVTQCILPMPKRRNIMAQLKEKWSVAHDKEFIIREKELRPFLFKQVYKFSRSQNDVEDLLQAGRMGLMVAIIKFDPDRGVKFFTYAYLWIIKFIRNESRVQRNTIKIPDYIYDKSVSTLKGKPDTGLTKEEALWYISLGEPVQLDPHTYGYDSLTYR